MKKLLVAVTTLVLFACTALFVYLFLSGRDPLPFSAKQADRTLQPGMLYRIIATKADIPKTDSDGHAWDWLSNSAPDCFYTVEWDGVVIYESVAIRDTFFPVWEEATLNIEDIIRNRTIAVSKTGGVFKVEPDHMLTVSFQDNDPGPMNKSVARWEGAPESLLLGDNNFASEDGVTFTLRVLPGAD